MQHDDAIRDEAAAWAVRTGDPAFADWDGFEAWLARSPENARAYDTVVAAVDEAADGLREIWALMRTTSRPLAEAFPV